MMHDEDQFRQFAQECRDLAKQARNDQHRHILEEMAAAWLKLAQETEEQKRSKRLR